MLDTIIRNALIVDGAGNPGYYGDLAVENGLIAAMGHLPAAKASTVIDASGKVLCPGFIDVHLHSEVDLLAGIHVEGVQMGVTTELICPDGISYSPMPPAMVAEYGRYVFGLYGSIPAVPNPRDFAGYLNLFKGKMHNNIVAQAPHGVIRLAVKGWATGPATPDEIAAMQKLVRECMEAGAAAFNTGLGYAPAAHAALPEIVALCKVAAEYGGVYAAHMRNYGDERDASIAETVAISEHAGIPVHINHFSGTSEMYASAEAARARGIDITWDAYPYAAGCTLLSYYGLPVAMFNRPLDTLIANLCEPSLRHSLQDYLDSAFPLDSPARFAFTKLPANKWMEGKTVRQAWQASGKSFVDFYCDLLIEEDLAPLLIFPWTDPPDMIEARLRHTLTHPLQMVSTDGIYISSHTHPRGYGAYPRILGRYVREQGWLRLEDAIRRMTSFPATRFGLGDRGLLRKGMAADLVVFDPQAVLDQATYDNPRQAPLGIEHVFVNGIAAVANGAVTGRRPGVLVKPS